MKTLDEITKLLDEYEAGLMTRKEFIRQWRGMNSQEADEYLRAVDESWKATA